MFDRREQRLARVVGELEARALAGARIPRLDGVIKTAGRPHDRNGPVFQAVNLVQSAGLVARRHQEHIRARFNLVCDGIVVRDLDRNLVRKLFVEPLEHLFEQLVA